MLAAKLNNLFGSIPGFIFFKDLQSCLFGLIVYHSAGKRDRDPNPPPVVCSKVAEGGREL